MVGVHNTFDDRQSQSGADHKPGLGIFDPVKTVKNPIKVFLGDTNACVRYPDTHIIALH